MISVTKEFDNPPKGLLKSVTDSLLKEVLETKNKHKFNKSIYRGKTLDELLAIYKNKCAYCETNTLAGATLQVEHYRPKAKLIEDKEHLGYYWLAYEWTNLTLGCSICNQNKSNSFPVEGNRVFAPNLTPEGVAHWDFVSINSEVLLAEKALFLNPEIDKVEEHFIFMPDGTIKGLTNRAEITINKLKLNREWLVFARAKTVKELIAEIKELLHEFLLNMGNNAAQERFRGGLNVVFKRIAKLQEPENNYSRFGYFVFYKFDIFVANQFEPKQKDLLLRMFELFKKNEL